MNNMRRLFSSFLLIGSLAGSGFLVTALISGSAAGQDHKKRPAAAKQATRLSAEDDAFLDELSRRSFQFFWDASDPNTGITREHLYWDGSPYPAEIRDAGSTGATGFGITALCIGAEHPLPPESWYAWERPANSYGGYKYIGVSLLWTYQYPFARADFRGRREKREPHTDWFANAQTATRAHRIFCIDLKKEFPGYSEDIWGITSSTSKSGYKTWGGPPRRNSSDRSVVPCAAAGSLMLTPDISIPALRTMKKQYGDKIWNQYGFADAFYPNTGWVSPEVIGLDAGITLLSAGNLRTGNVWRWFMRNPEIVHAMELARLQ